MTFVRPQNQQFTHPTCSQQQQSLQTTGLQHANDARTSQRRRGLCHDVVWACYRRLLGPRLSADPSPTAPTTGAFRCWQHHHTTRHRTTLPTPCTLALFIVCGSVCCLPRSAGGNFNSGGRQNGAPQQVASEAVVGSALGRCLGSGLGEFCGSLCNGLLHSQFYITTPSAIAVPSAIRTRLGRHCLPRTCRPHLLTWFRFVLHVCTEQCSKPHVQAHCDLQATCGSSCCCSPARDRISGSMSHDPFRGVRTSANPITEHLMYVYVPHLAAAILLHRVRSICFTARAESPPPLPSEPNATVILPVVLGTSRGFHFGSQCAGAACRTLLNIQHTTHPAWPSATPCLAATSLTPLPCAFRSAREAQTTCRGIQCSCCPVLPLTQLRGKSRATGGSSEATYMWLWWQPWVLP